MGCVFCKQHEKGSCFLSIELVYIFWLGSLIVTFDWLFVFVDIHKYTAAILLVACWLFGVFLFPFHQLLFIFALGECFVVVGIEPSLSVPSHAVLVRLSFYVRGSASLSASCRAGLALVNFLFVWECYRSSPRSVMTNFLKPVFDFSVITCTLTMVSGELVPEEKSLSLCPGIFALIFRHLAEVCFLSVTERDPQMPATTAVLWSSALSSWTLRRCRTLFHVWQPSGDTSWK